MTQKKAPSKKNKAAKPHNKGKKRAIRRVTCPECNGHGGHDLAQVCPVCDDEGYVYQIYWRKVK